MRGIPTLTVLAGACAAVALSAVPAVAASSPYNRNCGTPRDGFLTVDEKYESSGPWHITMSPQTARNIARRVGPNEFQPAGSHPSATDVPCDAAQSIASAGANAWTQWSANTGTITAGWTGYATGPSFGRFHCTGVTLNDGSVKETCAHRADRHAGSMTGSFVIQPAPPN
jgi:hypothetical protein